jgi:choline-sulfatase
LPIDVPDSKSLLPQLRDPTTGAGPAYAENHGSRYRLTQRILWDGCWKFVFNGFDFDELYDLENDPAETVNLIDEPAQQDRADAMMREIWNRIHTTGDRTLEESHYFSLRLGRVGPEPDL